VKGSQKAYVTADGTSSADLVPSTTGINLKVSHWTRLLDQWQCVWIWNANLIPLKH